MKGTWSFLQPAWSQKQASGKFCVIRAIDCKRDSVSLDPPVTEVACKQDRTTVAFTMSNDGLEVDLPEDLILTNEQM